MSFANRMRRERRTGAMVVAALVGAMGMGATQAPPPPVSAPTTAQAPREFVHVTPAKKRAKPTVVNRVTPKGRGLDNRKARRRILMQMAGRENTGRQWVRVRRAIRCGPAAPLLHTAAWKLAAMHAAGQRLVFAGAAS